MELAIEGQGGIAGLAPKILLDRTYAISFERPPKWRDLFEIACVVVERTPAPIFAVIRVYTIGKLGLARGCDLGVENMRFVSVMHVGAFYWEPGR